MKTTIEDERKEIARMSRIKLCEAFKEMTFQLIKRLTYSPTNNPDEIRAIRECLLTIVELNI